jgi:4'-phosphopantetheinyl transferase
MTTAGTTFHSFLDGSRIDVWHVPSARVSPAVVSDCYKTLSSQEITRARKYRTSDLRRSFVISRGFVRTVLGSYMNAAPRDIELVYGDYGKPHVINAAGLEFSVSHTKGHIAIACVQNCKMGIDIEAIRPTADLQAIAQMCFTPDEISQISRVAAGDSERAFYLCWARKEAYVKAIGTGLSRPLKTFQIELDLQRNAYVISMEPQEQRLLPEWTVRNIEIVEHCAAALAYNDRPRLTRLTTITEPSDLERHS